MLLVLPMPSAMQAKLVEGDSFRLKDAGKDTLATIVLLDPEHDKIMVKVQGGLQWSGHVSPEEGWVAVTNKYKASSE